MWKKRIVLVRLLFLFHQTHSSMRIKRCNYYWNKHDFQWRRMVVCEVTKNQAFPWNREAKSVYWVMFWPSSGNTRTSNELWRLPSSFNVLPDVTSCSRRSRAFQNHQLRNNYQHRKKTRPLILEKIKKREESWKITAKHCKWVRDAPIDVIARLLPSSSVVVGLVGINFWCSWPGRDGNGPGGRRVPNDSHRVGTHSLAPSIVFISFSFPPVWWDLQQHVAEG